MALDPIKVKPVEKIVLNSQAVARAVLFSVAFSRSRSMGRTGRANDRPD